MVLALVLHFEHDHYLGKKRVALAEVRGDGEGEAVDAQLQWIAEQGPAATVVIGLAAADERPVVPVVLFERHGNAGCGPAARGVEDMRRDSAHDTSFNSRSRVILR